MPKMTRRTILRVAAATGLVGLGGLASSRTVRGFWSARWVLARPKPSPLSAAPPGALTQGEEEILWSLYQTIEAYWKLKSDVSRDDLLEILQLKTEQPPSYLMEYRQASAAFRKLSTERGPDNALVKLLKASRTNDDGKFTPEAHIQDWVIGEMINLSLIRGGFRQFGISKYAGFPGGPFGYRKANWPSRQGMQRSHG